MINSISFKAKYINSDTVQIHKPFSTKYIPKKVDYVALDPNDKVDFDAVTKAGKKWNRGDSYAFTIAKDVEHDSLFHAISRRYFAIVEEGTAEELKPDDILGIAEITNTSGTEAYLDFIQVIPCYVNGGANIINPHIKNIGTTLMRNICKTFKDKNIKLQAIGTTREFYKKFGFEMINNTNKMIRKANFMKVI